MSAKQVRETAPGCVQDSPESSLGILTKQFDRESDPLAAAKKYPGKFKLQRMAQKLLPDKRVSTCYRNVYDSDSYAHGSVMGRSSGGKAEFSNLWVCGSPWDCPVCSSKISAARSQDVLKAMDYAASQGLIVELLTLTVPHTIFQPAKHVIRGLAKARTHFKQSKAYRAYKAQSGWKGEIWATEVTYGRNGWHPHNHALVFAESSKLEMLREQWTASVIHAGLGLVNHHGFNVKDRNYSAEYVSKWGLEHELTRADLKKGRFNGVSPFQILAACLDPCYQSDKVNYPTLESAIRLAAIHQGFPGPLFVEYSKAFHGRPQLLWTDGLKALLKVGEESDEELAGEPEIDPDFPHERWFLDQAGWMLVLGANARGELLYLAAKYGQFGVDYLVSLLRGLEGDDEPWYSSVSRNRVGVGQ